MHTHTHFLKLRGRKSWVQKKRKNMWIQEGPWEGTPPRASSEDDNRPVKGQEVTCPSPHPNSLHRYERAKGPGKIPKISPTPADAGGNVGGVGAGRQGSDNPTKFPSPGIGEFCLKPPWCECGTRVRKCDKTSWWRRGRHCRKLPGPKTKGQVGMETSQ